MTSKLLPCPFCGDVDNLIIDNIDYKDNEDLPEWLRDGMGYFVLCYECNARGSEKANDYEAVMAWNRRG